MIPTIERRSETRQLIEIRDAGSHPVLAGYAIVYGARSLDLGGFVEVIAPGAATKTLSEADVLAYAYHESSAMLGRTSSGTLRLSEDDHGVPFEIDLPQTTTGRDLAELVRRGDVKGSSFGFRTIADTWNENDPEPPGVLRTVTELALHHVAPTPDPAYPDTEAALRSLAGTRHLDLAQVRDAAKRRALGDLLADGDAGEEHDGDGGDDGRASTVAPAAASFVF